jgi:L-alanine-DL-glutamate epimerase-like enolase superfamily enzyme
MSKIAAVKIHPIAASLKRAQRTAFEPRKDVTLILVEVVTDDGLTGYGQVSSTPMKDIVPWIEKFA